MACTAVLAGAVQVTVADRLPGGGGPMVGAPGRGGRADRVRTVDERVRYRQSLVAVTVKV